MKPINTITLTKKTSDYNRLLARDIDALREWEKEKGEIGTIAHEAWFDVETARCRALDLKAVNELPSELAADLESKYREVCEFEKGTQAIRDIRGGKGPNPGAEIAEAKAAVASNARAIRKLGADMLAAIGDRWTRETWKAAGGGEHNLAGKAVAI